MSLDYRLKEPYTNEDLPQDQENHRNFCLYMLAVDVGELDEAGLKKFEERSSIMAIILDDWPHDLLVSYANHEAVRGMTTNIITTSDAEFRKKVWRQLVERAERNRKRRVASK